MISTLHDDGKGDHSHSAMYTSPSHFISKPLSSFSFTPSPTSVSSEASTPIHSSIPSSSPIQTTASSQQPKTAISTPTSTSASSTPLHSPLHSHPHPRAIATHPSGIHDTSASAEHAVEDAKEAVEIKTEEIKRRLVQASRTYDWLFYVVDNGNSRIQVLDPNGQFVTSFGELGAGLDQLNTPGGICLQPGSQHIGVADSRNNRIQIFDLAFNYCFTIGQKNQLRAPNGVACDVAGNWAIADYGNNRVHLYDAKGRMVRTIGGYGSSSTEFNRPFDVYFDQHNRLLVCDGANSRVSIWSRDGSNVQGFITTLLLPCVVREDWNEALHVGCTNTSRTYPQSSMEVYDARNIRDPIQTIGQAGKRAGEFDEVHGICFDGNNLMYVTDGSNDRIQVFENIPK